MLSTLEAVRPLSVALREGTTAEHAAAEHSSFMEELLAGRINERGYVDYLLRLRMIYAALEDGARTHRADPLVAAVYDPALERLAAIDTDLQHWATAAGDAADDLDELDSPAATAYRDRIAGATWGGALVAHHYTRYLGDLSGGLAIGKLLGRAFDLDGAGLAFYHFPMRPKPYKDAYRARLDALEPDAAQVDRMVEEARIAFGLNQALFAELAENLPAYRR